MSAKKLMEAGAALVLMGFSGNLFARGNSDSPPPPPPAHHAASAPVTAPIGAGIPHNSVGTSASHNFSVSAPYKPMTTVHANGRQTLIYPGVRNSIIHNPTTSKLNAAHSGASRGGSGKLGSQSATGVVTKTKLDPQTSAQLRNWTGHRSSTAQAHQINANNVHHHHDHNWWRHHCPAIIFFDWGWWGWYDGWWYPAWGYDPYSNYEYNEPIYASNGLAPDQIVAGVQAELQRRGYYTYAIDGKMGPLTQSAIARYQRDHHMSITSGIDSPTLNSLGILH
jgi:hypothetical protein